MPQIPSGARLAYVSQWFPPEAASASLWIAEAMRDTGYAVGVVTGAPHYPHGTTMQGYSGTAWLVEDVHGFRTMRVPEYPSHDTSALRRMATFGSFAVSSAALASRQIAKADVCLVYGTPATAALPAMVARARGGTPYVLLVQDLWPDSVFATGFLGGGIRGFAETTVGAFVDASYRAASHICAITPGMRERIIERGVPESKVTLVYNWVDENTMRPTPGTGELRRRLGLSGNAFVAIFAGNMGQAQGLRAWVEAMDQLGDRPDICLAFLGGGTQRDELVSLVEQRDLGHRVRFLDRVAPSEVPSLTADADVSVISLADHELFAITMPSKFQAALAMGQPIVASMRGDVADVVEDSQAGWVAAPEDPDSIAAAIRVAADAGPEERAKRGSQGRRFYEQHMARAIGSQRLANVLSEAMDHKRSA